jgi:hypothetical protein
MVNEYNEVNLLWGKSFFKSSKKHRRNITGWNISGLFRSYGKATLVDGSMCIWLKNKKMRRLNSSIQLKRYIGKDSYYYTYPVYFSIGYKFKIVGHSYAKIVRCSRLVSARQKW